MGSTCLTKGKCIRLWRKMLAVWIAESCNCATIVRSVPGAGMAEAAIILRIALVAMLLRRLGAT